jgi:ABC-type transport system involved in Fe-S cluster assembly fused permease/ATPase subunit
MKCLDFSLTVNAGQSVAFVGPSGCGKSTLFSILLRFYDISRGEILIDGQCDLRNLNLKWWLRNMGVVSQDAVIFKVLIPLIFIFDKLLCKLTTKEEKKHCLLQLQPFNSRMFFIAFSHFAR